GVRARPPRPAEHRGQPPGRDAVDGRAARLPVRARGGGLRLSRRRRSVRPTLRRGGEGAHLRAARAPRRRGTAQRGGSLGGPQGSQAHRVGLLVRRIAVLPPDVQGQIAAGEVVERPASVVKELVENALDAGARHVEVRLAGGGVERITVVDDGAGMAPEDAVLAFARHATSKLTDLADLAAVGTLGFRGEALPSIAAAGAVRIVTRRADDAVGSAVEADAHGARAAGPAARAPGTTVDVHELFATTPARRKFLRTPATEVGHVVDCLTRLAVAAPETGFRLLSERGELFAYPPVQDVRQRLAQVLGTERARHFVEVAANQGGVTITGLLGPPRESIASARLLWTYVGFRNGEPGAVRCVRDRVLTHAILDGYESLVVRGRYPAAVLMVRVAPGELDVNVHPAKLEIRFQRSAAVHQLVAGVIRARLRAVLAPPASSGDGVATPGLGPGDASALGEPTVPYVVGADAVPRLLLAGADDDAQASLWQPATE